MVVLVYGVVLVLHTVAQRTCLNVPIISSWNACRSHALPSPGGLHIVGKLHAALKKRRSWTELSSEVSVDDYCRRLRKGRRCGVAHGSADIGMRLPYSSMFSSISLEKLTLERRQQEWTGHRTFLARVLNNIATRPSSPFLPFILFLLVSISTGVPGVHYIYTTSQSCHPLEVPQRMLRRSPPWLVFSAPVRSSDPTLIYQSRKY
jgi:hypothetical protein